MEIDLTLKIQEIVSYLVNLILIVYLILLKFTHKKTSAPQSVEIFTKRDYTYWLILLSLVTLMLFTDNSSSSDEFNNKLEFAATVVSIILAIIAILLTLIEGYRSTNVQQKLDLSAEKIMRVVQKLENINLSQQDIHKKQDELMKLYRNFRYPDKFNKTEIDLSEEEYSKKEVFQKFNIMLVQSYLDFSKILIYSLREAYYQQVRFSVIILARWIHRHEDEEGQEMFTQFSMGAYGQILNMLSYHNIIDYDVNDEGVKVKNFESDSIQYIDSYYENDKDEEIKNMVEYMFEKLKE